MSPHTSSAYTVAPHHLDQHLDQNPSAILSSTYRGGGIVRHTGGGCLEKGNALHMNSLHVHPNQGIIPIYQESTNHREVGGGGGLTSTPLSHGKGLFPKGKKGERSLGSSLYIERAERAQRCERDGVGGEDALLDGLMGSISNRYSGGNLVVDKLRLDEGIGLDENPNPNPNWRLDEGIALEARMRAAGDEAKRMKAREEEESEVHYELEAT